MVKANFANKNSAFVGSYTAIILDYYNFETNLSEKNNYCNDNQSNDSTILDSIVTDNSGFFKDEIGEGYSSLTVRKALKNDKKVLGNRVDTNNFETNLETLPWPLKNGIVYNYFGIHPHPVLNGIFVNNGGIEIVSANNSFARAVFKGEINKIVTIPGENQAVIISHGDYFTVYANLNSIFVRVGDIVNIRQKIGTISKNEDNMPLLKFQIWYKKEKLDPLIWLYPIR